MKAKKPSPPEPLTFMRFVDEFYPALKMVSSSLEMDYNFHENAVVLHDMRTPSSIRTVAAIRPADLALPRGELTELFVDKARSFLSGEQARGNG